MSEPTKGPPPAADLIQIRLQRKLTNAVSGEPVMTVMSTTLGMSMNLAYGMRITKEQYLDLVDRCWDQYLQQIQLPLPSDGVPPTPNTSGT